MLIIFYRDMDSYSYKRFSTDDIKLKYDDNLMFVFDVKGQLKFAIPINRIVYCEVKE